MGKFGKMNLDEIMFLLHSNSRMKVVEYCGNKVYGVFDHDNPMSDEMNNYKVISIENDKNFILVNVLENV